MIRATVCKTTAQSAAMIGNQWRAMSVSIASKSYLSIPNAATSQQHVRMLPPSSSHIPTTLQYSTPNPSHQQQHIQTRQYSFDNFNGSSEGNGDMWEWPVTKTNTIFNIVPQGHRYVVERFGKVHEVHESGYFLAIPFVDNIAYVIDVRERAMDIVPQAAITRDNVSVEVSGNLFIRFLDPHKAAYGARNPLYSVTQHAQSAMRSAIGELELDEILHGRAKLNAMIKGSLQEAAEPWGLEVRRYEITEITPDAQIRIAMDKQAAAERDRRERVLRAEGAKRQAELESEGVKIKLTNESEGDLIKVSNEAEAEKIKILLEAEANAQAVSLAAKAQADALRKISDELRQPTGKEAARLALAQNYVTMYGEMGSQSNTILFNDRPADVSALMSQAVTALKVTDAATTTTKGSSSLVDSKEQPNDDHVINKDGTYKFDKLPDTN